MENQAVRLLRADEIECRTAAVNERGLSLLLYKDARVDQRILDETFGAFGWKRSHQAIEGSLYCTVEIKDTETGEWVAKQDVGSEGSYGKEKSQASDSFKRACFNWGIGRELYSAPFIWIPATKVQIQKKDGRHFCNERFQVASITYNAAYEISGLEIADSKGEAVFSWKSRKTADPSYNREMPTVQQPHNGRASMAQQPHNGAAPSTRQPYGRELSIAQMESLEAELQRTGIGIGEVQERYHIKDPTSMPEEIYGRVMKALARTKSAGAA